MGIGAYHIFRPSIIRLPHSGLREETFHFHLKRLRDGGEFIIHNRAGAVLDFCDLPLAEQQPLSCQPADHVLLGNLRRDGHAGALDGGTRRVAFDGGLFQRPKIYIYSPRELFPLRIK
jgi:hypothetical protein